jgi:hypothetical protein
VREGLQPTSCAFAVSNLGSQPGASAAVGPPEGEAQGIPKKLAALARARGRQIGRANTNALAAEGNEGRGLVAQPVGEGGLSGWGCRSARASESECAPWLLQQLLPVKLGLV